MLTFPRSCRGMELQERLICGGRWTLWQVLSSTRTDLRIVSTFVLFPRHYTNWHKVAVSVCACGQWRPCCSDSCPSSSTCQRAKSSDDTSLGSRAPRRKLHSHEGYNDLVPDEHGGKILPSFSIILIVNEWSVMFPRCTTTFPSDGLVNWLYKCDFWIGIRSGRHFIYSLGGFPEVYSSRLCSAQEALARRC